MKIFIFEYVNELTDRYHGEGGLAVVAKDRVHAQRLIDNNYDNEAFDGYTRMRIHLTEEEWEKVIVYDLKKDEEPRIFVFPDAGCC